MVEDSLEVVRILKDCLKTFDLHIATNLETAQKNIQNSQFDLILMDIGLPDGDGIRFFTQLKNQNKDFSSPVIFLTSKTQTEDIVMAFNLGAEDYITKPFNPFELRARIEAKMKLIRSRKNESAILRFESLTINLNKHQVFVEENGKSQILDLTPLEFKILKYFAQNHDHVFNREQLIENIWGFNTNISDRAVDTHISNLRKKIKDSSHSIFSIYGTGYVFRKISAAA